MKKVEIIEKRKAREKHFLKENGEMVAEIYDEDVHYLNNGEYKEINNTLVKNRNYYVNKSNNFKTYFGEKTEQLMKIVSNKNKIEIDLNNKKEIVPKRIKSNNKLFSSIVYENILDNIDIEYKIMPSKVKEDIILKNVNAINSDIVFKIKTNLNLETDKNGLIKAYKDIDKCFVFEKPYMIDDNGVINNNTNYELINRDEYYELKLVVDKEWLANSNTKYPVVIDPTITNNGQNNSVYDTYIYPGDTNVTRYNKDILKVGVEKVNGVDIVNRALLKFDLPTIGTGDQIVNATLNLVGYAISDDSYTDKKILNVHQITEDWTESGANWNNMNDKFNTRIENCFWSERSKLFNNVITPKVCYCDLTNIVKKWYTDTPNYGIMIKLNNEVYTTSCLPSFYSNNNVVSGANPKPVLAITYRNQNGLENYIEYESQEFDKGEVYENLYNGNLTAIFGIGSTIGGKFPIGLDIIYNTNDVVLNRNLGYGLGCRFNFCQTIKEVTIGDDAYLEYIDGDGTIHYFKNNDNVFKDEEGLNLSIVVIENKYHLFDNEGNELVFEIKDNLGYLIEVSDVSKNKIVIAYDLNNKIVQLIDGNGNCINITYTDNNISIISPDRIVTLEYSDNKLISIDTNTGVTCFSYDDKNLLSSIVDEDGLKINYEYCVQKPYRIRRIIEYGVDDEIGSSYDIVYGFNTTKIIDDNNKSCIITFNSYGNTVSVIDLENGYKLKDAYGKKEIYGEKSNEKNKLVSNLTATKHTTNYLYNSSFSDDDIIFVSDEARISITNEISYSENQCLKLDYTDAFQEAFYLASVPENKFYTFSCYLMNSNNVKIALCYFNPQFEEIIVESDIIKPKTEFERESVTIFYSGDHDLEGLFIKVISLDSGVVYLDDIQLEEGEVANDYNYVENSNFISGKGSWDEWTSVSFEAGEITDTTLFDDGVFEVVEIENGINALKVNMNPRIETTLVQYFNIKGSKNDTYSVNFWYKNTGVKPFNLEKNSFAVLDFMYGDDYDDNSNVLTEQLNSDCDEWQYFTTTFTAKEDFSQIRLSIYQKFNANEFYITNISVHKDSRKTDYDYDENGNLVLIKNLNNCNEKFKYDNNNQLIKEVDERNKKLVFEYDSLITDKILKGVSESGISYCYRYDEDNPTSNKVVNNSVNLDNDEVLCSIRLQGTNKYLKNINNRLRLSDEGYLHNKWILEKLDSYYAVKHSIVDNKYLSVLNDEVILSNENEKALFSIIENDNGSFSLKLENNQHYVDKYLKFSETLKIADLDKNNSIFNVYFENDTYKCFVEENYGYTEDSRFVKETVDANLNSIKYDIDPLTGITNSVTNPKNITTYYIYNDKEQLTKVQCGDRNVQYSYNDGKLIDNIIKGNGIYHFSYDNFLNLKQVKIGDNITYVTNYYEDNNGNLSGIVYGNNDTLSYAYDDFDRVKTIFKMDNTYSNKYGNDGNLIKVMSQNDTTEFLYDTAKRLYEYRFNDFKIKYKYDASDNIIKVTYKLGDNVETIDNIYNDDGEISKVLFDNNSEINCNYDKIGRLCNKNINNSFNIQYQYLSNGNRSSLLLKNMITDTDFYSYKYDEMNNITHIYCNDILNNKYYYDNYNQLIREDNYMKNTYINYKYDNYGNILSKSKYNMNDYSLISRNTYEYNDNWGDLLTKFNDELITYDNIGNIIRIGDEKMLTWINGRELKSYIDSSNNINVQYLYDSEGIRLSKNVNGIKTEYYLEDDEIIFEKTDDYMLYYIRDEEGYIEGLKFNNDLYYFVKNNRNDIIGILNRDYVKIASYEYDGYGNILSIKDNDGNEIENKNHIAHINPFRYRSYYYDKETGFYYLKDRYYNPLWGRFINADTYGGEIGGNYLSHNLYIYALNNPIMNVDESGNFACFAPVVGLALRAIVKTVTKFVSKKAVKIASALMVGSIAGKNATPNVSVAKPSSNPRVKSRSINSASNSRANTKSKANTKSNKAPKKTNNNPNRGKRKSKPCTTAKLTVDGKNVVRGKRLTIQDSVKHVKKGGNVMCDTKIFAEAVAFEFPTHTKCEIDQRQKPGYTYYRHYHPDRFSHRHIWFLPGIKG